MSEFDYIDWKNSAPLRQVANVANDIMHRLAEAADAEYARACADSCNTNSDPVGEAQQFVRLLHQVILEINGSGFCDSGTFERFVGYNTGNPNIGL
jgi:hypothetical protein